MIRYRKKIRFVFILQFLLCALFLSAQDRSFLIVPPDYLSGTDDEPLSGETAELAKEFAQLLAGELGSASKTADTEAYGVAEIRGYALLQEADAVVRGFFLVGQSTENVFFGRMVLTVIDLIAEKPSFSLVYQGSFSQDDPSSLPSLLADLAAQAAGDILVKISPLSNADLERLRSSIREAKSEKRARQTLRFTLRSEPDAEAVVVFHDGSSPGTLATGELSFEIPAESRYRLTVEKPGHYTRIVEGLAGTEDISISIPELYPEKGKDFGVIFSYLRPFGLLFEGRYRLFRESATLGASVGLFPLPDYWEDYVFAPDFGDLLIESELGFHLGWYPFTRADSRARLQLELNMRINTYTNPYQEWRTFRTLMTGAGLRLELNRPQWLAHIGVRGYYPNYTPAKVRESGIVLINMGAAWKE